jgi:hypothetical protein
LESNLELYLLKKAPSLPDNVKEFIVKFSPWISLVVGLMALPAILAVLGVGTLVMPFSYLGGFRYGLSYSLSMLIFAVATILDFAAIPGLFKRSASAWRLLYYSTLINAVHYFLTFNWGSLIIGTLISFYILFQVKSYYQ